MDRRRGKGGSALKISLKIVFVDLKNPWKNLESSFQRSVGILIFSNGCMFCEMVLGNIFYITVIKHIWHDNFLSSLFHVYVHCNMQLLTATSHI